MHSQQWLGLVRRWLWYKWESHREQFLTLSDGADIFFSTIMIQIHKRNPHNTKSGALLCFPPVFSPSLILRPGQRMRKKSNESLTKWNKNAFSIRSTKRGTSPGLSGIFWKKCLLPEIASLTFSKVYFLSYQGSILFFCYRMHLP